jgi:putative tryptophan/tyrosine transport system substrate-binding protein
LIPIANRYAIPTIYPLRQYAEAGGLMSFGANLPEAFRQCGIYVGKILKGAIPADLPVLQPSIYELVINLKTAKKLGLPVSPTLQALADEVIDSLRCMSLYPGTERTRACSLSRSAIGGKTDIPHRRVEVSV